ncbi:hypothetical protein RirG_088650 [Rhizophagus irregularis DAOM 197198w]|uniref:Uncharacterized protein n=1 Tax=Rhizophagus irregularis (strain DAOM 197198w) TaxID=1432141 RepID=A0A015LCQ9_RHIIW|nr:hypothetical protein RirG_088650 [Rhizophagus irregularis DAOM 197198w]
MKKWFCENDKKFIKKDYESMLRVPEMTDEENSFVLKVEDMVYKGHVSQAYKYCTEIHSSSIEDSYLYKISKYMEICELFDCYLRYLFFRDSYPHYSTYTAFTRAKTKKIF